MSFSEKLSCLHKHRIKPRRRSKTLAVFMGFPILGTPDECINAIEKFMKNGVRHFILGVCAPNEESYLDSLTLYAKKVILYFK